jgi:3-phosphoglycerate kinase
MQLKTIRQIKSLKNKRVLLRLDLNIPLGKRGIRPEDTWRLQKAIPTINYLVNKGAKVIIVAHLGRPEGKKVKKLSLKPIADYLARLTGRSIELWTKDITSYPAASQELLSRQVVMLENIRFQPREKKNCKRLAKSLSKLADIYVNDAFGNMHRSDTSMLAITEFLPSYAGLLVAEEVKHLSKVLQTKKGLVVMFGGAKVTTKIKLIRKFLRRADAVLLGGMLANTLLVARGYDLGHSLVKSEELNLAKKLKHRKLFLPQDVVIASALKAKKSSAVLIDQVPAKMMALDIGPKTVGEYYKIIKSAKLIIWNGPLGYFENEHIIKNSLSLAKKIVKSPAKVIIGGGETVAMISRAGLRDKFDFVSTGGGAMLTFLEGEKMPALEKLK